MCGADLLLVASVWDIVPSADGADRPFNDGQAAEASFQLLHHDYDIVYFFLA